MDFSNLVVLFRVLWRKMWLIISVPVIAMLVTLALTWEMPDRYKSTAQLSTGFTTNEQILITNDPSSYRDISIKFNNLIETMTSEIILTLVSYRLVLHDYESGKPFRRLTSEQLAAYSLEDIDLIMKICRAKLENMELLSSFDPDERKVMNFISLFEYSSWQLVEELQVARIKDTDYLKIQYISEDPRLSAFVVNILSEECIRYDNKIKQSRSGQSVTFFENLTNDKKKILDEKTALLNSYKTSNNVVNYSLETTSRIAQIAEYELRRNEAVAKIQGLRLSISNTDKRLRELGNVLTTTSSNDKLLQLRSKIDELNKIYVDGGSKDESLKKTLSELRYEYQVEMDKLASVEQLVGQPQANQQLALMDQKNQFELELEIANANLASINSALATLNNSVSGIANKEVTVSFLTAEVENAAKEYKEALDRFNTERNKSLVAASPLRLVVAGQPNGYPERSKRLIFIGFAGFASFVLCIATIVAIELLDLRLKNPDQFRKLVALDLAGTLNHINSKRLNLEFLFKAQMKGRELDTFKHFLRNLRFVLESTGAKTFLVTSMKEAEGKSFIILCLAYSLSLVKKRVLIIDTNFRHNSLTQELLAVGTEHKKLESGFYIKGLIGKGPEPEEIPEEDFVASIIFPTSHKGINVIGNSGGDQSPSEIFAGRDFGKMMLTLKDRYDYIFLEGAALNNYSDTKELIAYVDKVIPVFNSASTMRRLDYESLKYLKSLNGKLMGSILNGIELRELKV